MYTDGWTEVAVQICFIQISPLTLTGNNHSPYSENERSLLAGGSMTQFDAFQETIDDAEAPRSRAERRDQQTHRILEAAKRCFVLCGFQGASMNQICTEAGMSPGALYRYFPSKEAIVEAICEAARQQDADIFAKILSSKDVVDGVVLGAMAHIRFVHDTNAAAMFAEIAAEAMRNPAVEATCDKNLDQVQRMFHGYLRAAWDRGEINPPVALEVLVPTMLAICHGMAVHNLPAHGVEFDQLEILLRSIMIGMLRPVSSADRSS